MVIREKLSRVTHLYTCGFNAIRVFKLSAFLLPSSMILICFVNPSEMNMRQDAIWCILRHNFEKCYNSILFYFLVVIIFLVI